MAINNGKFTPNSTGNPTGPLSPLYNNFYSFDHTFYPRNLDTDQRGHYIIFYVNVAQNTKYTAGPGGNNYEFVSDFAGTTASNAKPILNIPFTDDGTGKERSINLARKTKRIKQAMTLYMPETVNVQYQANWQDTSLTDTFGLAGFLGQNASSAVKSVKNLDVSNMSSLLSTAMKELEKNTPALAEGGGTIVDNLIGSRGAGDILLFAGGYAINPQLEVLFKGVGLRSFQFDFVFSPYDRTEAENIKKIIDSFKFHAAPEIYEGAGSGRYMIPPSEFDIEFMFKGQVNSNIHKIGTCVLTGINVDYAPNGWTTFGGQPGETGAGFPTQSRLTLQFMETEIVTKQRTMEGY
jgi:hypothetical protein